MQALAYTIYSPKLSVWTSIWAIISMIRLFVIRICSNQEQFDFAWFEGLSQF